MSGPWRAYKRASLRREGGVNVELFSADSTSNPSPYNEPEADVFRALNNRPVLLRRPPTFSPRFIFHTVSIPILSFNFPSLSSVLLSSSSTPYTTHHESNFYPALIPLLPPSVRISTYREVPAAIRCTGLVPKRLGRASRCSPLHRPCRAGPQWITYIFTSTNTSKTTCSRETRRLEILWTDTNSCNPGIPLGPHHEFGR